MSTDNVDNAEFDESVALAEFHRSDMRNHLSRRSRICTICQSIEFGRNPGEYAYKQLTQVDLHTVFIGKICADKHDAPADVPACSNYSSELKQRGVLIIPHEKGRITLRWSGRSLCAHRLTRR